jgi:transcription elongation GreA/GreB family factor
MQKELVILDEDKEYIRRLIAELQRQIQDLGPEFYEVFNQSSETWHDNAPFDALRDRQSVLDAELQSLRRALRNSAVSVPKPQKGKVGIGSTVHLSDGRVFFIAGDYTPHAGKTSNGVTVISCQSPLAQKLLDQKVGECLAIGKEEARIESVS